MENRSLLFIYIMVHLSLKRFDYDAFNVDTHELHLIKDLCRLAVIADEDEDARGTIGVFVLVSVSETDTACR